MTAHWLAEERSARLAGCRCVAGIDEAGRGALAGPVVAACVVLPPDYIPTGVDDSKKLSPAERARCFDIIVSSAIGIGVGCISCDVIDRINILRATHEAMRQAVANLPTGVCPDLALIDGLPVLPFPITQRSIVGGDGKSASIAAASIIAKVTRDRMMCELDARHPQYQFAIHKGYGTRAHLDAIIEHGPCSEHRRSFRPVANMASDGAAKQNHNGQHLLMFPPLDLTTQQDDDGGKSER